MPEFRLRPIGHTILHGARLGLKRKAAANRQAKSAFPRSMPTGARSGRQFERLRSAGSLAYGDNRLWRLKRRSARGQIAVFVSQKKGVPCHFRSVSAPPLRRNFGNCNEIGRIPVEGGPPILPMICHGNCVWWRWRIRASPDNYRRQNPVLCPRFSIWSAVAGGPVDSAGCCPCGHSLATSIRPCRAGRS